METKDSWFFTQTLWPNGDIPFEIDNDFSLKDKAAIIRVAHTWTCMTDVQFTPSLGDPKHVQVIHFDNQKVYEAELGFKDRQSQVRISKNEYMNYSSVLHEFGHVIGLVHEQQRPDRDDYVEIKTENIEDDYKFAFEKEGVVFGQYDFDSIMHYRYDSASKNGKPTIVPRSSDRKPIEFRQSNKPSKTDAATVDYFYRHEIDAKAIKYKKDRCQFLDQHLIFNPRAKSDNPLTQLAVNWEQAFESSPEGSETHEAIPITLGYTENSKTILELPYINEFPTTLRFKYTPDKTQKITMGDALRWRARMLPKSILLFVADAKSLQSTLMQSRDGENRWAFIGRSDRIEPFFAKLRELMQEESWRYEILVFQAGLSTANPEKVNPPGVIIIDHLNHELIELYGNSWAKDPQSNSAEGGQKL